MSLLIDDQKFINLKFHYIETPGQYTSKFEFIKDKATFEKHKKDPNLKEINTGWKILSWAEHNEIYSKCLFHSTKENEMTTTNLDYVKFRDMKMKFCLKSWDLKDDNDVDMPLNASMIDNLHHQVATEILEGFERVTEIETTDLKALETGAQAFFEGKKSFNQPPKIVYEFYVCQQMGGWTLDYVRTLMMPDFL